MFQIIWISESFGIKASKKIILRYIEFCMSNLAMNTIKWYVSDGCRWGITHSSSSQESSIGHNKRPVVSFWRPWSSRCFRLRGVVGESVWLIQLAISSFMRLTSSLRASFAPFWSCEMYQGKVTHETKGILPGKWNDWKYQCQQWGRPTYPWAAEQAAEVVCTTWKYTLSYSTGLSEPK